MIALGLGLGMPFASGPTAPAIDLTGFALLLEGGTDRILLEGDATDGDDILLLEGTA